MVPCATLTGLIPIWTSIPRVALHGFAVALTLGFVVRPRLGSTKLTISATQTHQRRNKPDSHPSEAGFVIECDRIRYQNKSICGGGSAVWLLQQYDSVDLTHQPSQFESTTKKGQSANESTLSRIPAAEEESHAIPDFSANDLSA